MKVGLLECDHVRAQWQHIAGDYRDMFAALFKQHAPQFELQSFNVGNGEFPATLDECDAYLTTGSRFSVYDDAAWIHTLKDFVRQLHAAEKPFVGVCFGHQMLAEALGGRVSKALTGWGAGVQNVAITQIEDWMRPATQQLYLQFMHQDQIAQLPPDSVTLGSAPHCPIAMFRVGRTMLGIQAHPEFTPDYVGALLDDRVALIGAEKCAAAQASLRQTTDEGLVTKWIAEFLKLSLMPR
jgi:GMP synthase-like glutamine amidotransferase